MFYTRDLHTKFKKLTFGFEILAPKNLYKKRTFKTLMKLTSGQNGKEKHRRRIYFTHFLTKLEIN